MDNNVKHKKIKNKLKLKKINSYNLIEEVPEDLEEDKSVVEHNLTQ